MLTGRLLHLLSTAPWAMHEPALQQLAHSSQDRGLLRGARLDEPARKRKAATQTAGTGTGTAGAVAIIRIRGVIDQHDDNWIDFFGGVSTERIARHFRAAMASPEIGAIVLDIDSPGGSVFGTPELAAEIFAARGKKRVVAVANSFAASAAYWIASAAEELVVTPSGEVGSVGCYMVHLDYSQYLEKTGITATVIRSGTYKAEGNPYEPLSEEAKDYRQLGTDRYHTMFINAVAKHRGVTATVVRKTYGEGRMVGAKDALDLGMVDAVATLEETVARVLKGQKKGGRAEGASSEEPFAVDPLRTPVALQARAAAALALVEAASR
jgi:capsid assembly protease